MSSSDLAPLDPAIGIALLAAGAGRRLGGGKLQADLGGRPLWRWASEAAEQAGFFTRWLIAAPEFAGEAPPGWQLAENAEASEGIAASLRLAAGLARGCRRLVVALADMPFVPPAHLRLLAEGDGTTFTRYPDGREGVPAAFPQGALPQLATLTGDRGARALPWGGGVTCLSPSGALSLLDIDTAADLARARAAIG